MSRLQGVHVQVRPHEERRGAFSRDTTRRDKRAVLRCHSRLDLCRCALYAAGKGSVCTHF